MISRVSNQLLLAIFFMVLSSAAFAKGRLGFAVEESTDGTASGSLKEVKVSLVRSGGPAEQAGLRTGDIITQLDGQPIAGTKGPALNEKLGSVKQGERLTLVILRGGKAMPIEIVAGPDQ